MKTRYLAEAQLSILNLNTTNQYLIDILAGDLFVGLLSSLPEENKDGWEGAGELFNAPGSPYLPGIKEPSINTAGYQAVPLNRSKLIVPTLVNTSLGLSGMLVEYREDIVFPIATSDWSEAVLGLVVYCANGPRITPLFTIEFLTPAGVNFEDQVVIQDTANTRMRAIELIKKNTIY